MTEQPKETMTATLVKAVAVLVLVFIGVIVAYSVIRDLSPDAAPPVKIAVMPSPSPSPMPTPNLSPAEHLAEAKKLMQYGYIKERYQAAIKHLDAVPVGAKEHREAKMLTSSAVGEMMEQESAGDAPAVSAWDNKVYCVDRYLKQTLNDYESAEYLQWTTPIKVSRNGQGYWQVSLRLRAKNAFGGKIVAVKSFLIQKDEVVQVLD